jgi:hypothetical protein
MVDRDDEAANTRRGFLAGAAGVGLGALVYGGLGAPGIAAQTAGPRAPFLVATDHGVRGTGAAGDRAALERLFGLAGDQGATVILPTGRYQLDAPLVVPRSISLSFARGACLTGRVPVQIDGSVEAGLQQIFDGPSVAFGPGSVPWVVPQWWGAQGDGVHDDTAALQAAFQARIVLLPAGKYRTTRELVVKNRSTIIGVGNSWSPTPTTDSWIQYDGPADESVAVVRAATAPVGSDPAAALDSVHIEKVVINGGNRAGYGLYSVYCTNDSSFSDITVRHCTRHGIFISQQWYASYRNLVARDNPGCGITIGQVFDGWRERGVNGIELSNLRAAQNGSDGRFDERTNLRWGYGVLFRPGAGTVLRQVVSEKNNGPGLIYDLGPFGSNRVEGGYLEKNGLAARGAGSGRAWGMVVIGHRNARANSVNSLYLHGAIGDARAQSVWLTGEEPDGRLLLNDLSFGHYLHADWSRYAFQGYIYPGLQNHIIGRQPGNATADRSIQSG